MSDNKSKLIDNKYSKMQKEYYNRLSNGVSKNVVRNKEALIWDNDPDLPKQNDRIVGHIINLNKFFNSCKFLFSRIDNLSEKRVLDFGCGPGRNISLYSDTFDRIDGVDICDVNIDFCREMAKKRELNSVFYKCNGYDLSEINSSTYDLVISFITLQHICVHDIRYNYFKEFNRVLKNGGALEIQMGFGNTASQNPVDYYENWYDSPTTNGPSDVRIDDPDLLLKDLESAGFHDLRYKIVTPRYFPNHDDKFIFVSGFKK